jgi:hypothetical protein
MSDSNRPPDIETLFSSLTPENQTTVLQKLLEAMKPPRSTTPPPNPVKHNLESPITPFKGKGRKVIEMSFIILVLISIEYQNRGEDFFIASFERSYHYQFRF